MTCYSSVAFAAILDVPVGRPVDCRDINRVLDGVAGVWSISTVVYLSEWPAAGFRPTGRQTAVFLDKISGESIATSLLEWTELSPARFHRHPSLTLVGFAFPGTKCPAIAPLHRTFVVPTAIIILIFPSASIHDQRRKTLPIPGEFFNFTIRRDLRLPPTVFGSSNAHSSFWDGDLARFAHAYHLACGSSSRRTQRTTPMHCYGFSLIVYLLFPRVLFRRRQIGLHFVFFADRMRTV